MVIFIISAKDTYSHCPPVLLLLPEEVHWGEFQKLIELVVECLHGVLRFYFGTM